MRFNSKKTVETLKLERLYVFFQPACKPGSVLFHHLPCPAIADRIVRPTPRHRTSSPKSRYTWSLNPQGVRLPVSLPEPVSSYLTFSPLSLAFARDSYFLLHCYILTDIFPLGSMVLCVARTFLLPLRGKRWISLLYCKSNKTFRYYVWI